MSNFFTLRFGLGRGIRFTAVTYLDSAHLMLTGWRRKILPSVPKGNFIIRQSPQPSSLARDRTAKAPPPPRGSNYSTSRPKVPASAAVAPFRPGNTSWSMPNRLTRVDKFYS
jgi:hypothetical protein